MMDEHDGADAGGIEDFFDSDRKIIVKVEPGDYAIIQTNEDESSTGIVKEWQATNEPEKGQRPMMSLDLVKTQVPGTSALDLPMKAESDQQHTPAAPSIVSPVELTHSNPLHLIPICSAVSPSKNLYSTLPGLGGNVVQGPSNQPSSNLEAPMKSLLNVSIDSGPTELSGVSELTDSLHEAPAPTVHKPHQCEHCGRCFGRKANMIIHAQTHARPVASLFKCPRCDKSFSTKKSCEEHVILNTCVFAGGMPGKLDTDKLFKCPLCGKGFQRKFNMQRHMKSHEDEKPFKCTRCANVFKMKIELEDHRALNKCNSASVTIEKPDSFQCEHCEKTLSTSTSLKRHKLLHSDGKAFQCEICGKGYTQKYHRDTHQKTHSKNFQQRTFPCKVCGVEFKIYRSLRMHCIKIHSVDIHGDKETKEGITDMGSNVDKESAGCKYTCDFCNREFVGAIGLQVHLHTHKVVTALQCRQCDKTFKSQVLLGEHKESHRSIIVPEGHTLYKCEHCSREFAGVQGLLVHVRSHTDVELLSCCFCERTFKSKILLTEHENSHLLEKPCEFCNRTFRKDEELEEHIRIHTGEKPFECHHGPKRFRSKANLDKHKFLHTGARPFICEHCNKAFKTKNDNKVHLRIHTGEKPFVCHCGKSFSHGATLRKHTKLVHADRKCFRCNKCERSFSSKSGLWTHKWYHTDEKTRNCRFCERRFSCAGACRNHESIHTGEKTYKCNYCDKSYRWKSSLDLHVRIHTGEKPFECKYCRKTFNNKSNLRVHKGKHVLKGDSLPPQEDG